MGRKSEYTKQQKIKACENYINGRESAIQIAHRLNPLARCLDSLVRKWARIYQEHGESAFDKKATNASYSSDFKIKVVTEYLKEGTSLLDLALKYKIHSDMTILTWTNKYNEGEKLSDYNPKSEGYNMKSRKVTIEEKREIINYVLASENDYKGAADKYSVPYHDVFNWVKKYRLNGESSFVDNRGRPDKTKPQEQLTEVELLKIELEKQKAINAKLELTNEILKKNIQIKERLRKDFRK